MSEIKICKDCDDQGKKSTLTVKHMYCSHAIAEPSVDTYDEEGKLITMPTHFETCDMNVDIFSCSNGHMWSEKRK